MNRIEREQKADEILTFEEATRFFKVSEPTLRKALKNGDVYGIRIGRQWRVFKYPPKVGLKNELESQK